MNSPKSYDFLIAGLGCSGLSIAWHLLQDPEAKNKTFLLLDPNPESLSDKTWCFWDESNLPSIVPIYRKWNLASVITPNKKNSFSLLPFRYNCVRSEDYSSSIFSYLIKQPNVTILKADVYSLKEVKNQVEVDTSVGNFSGSLAFKCFGQPNLEKSRFPLKQHFLGWNISVDKPLFDDSAVTFMDFTVPQIEGAVFMYVLPFSKSDALFEFTFFSKNVMDKEIYETEISNYLAKQYPGINYNINRTERGVIPMADASHTPGNNRIIHLGTASGSPKPSTGFSFSRIQHQAAFVAQNVAKGDLKAVHKPLSPYRYRFYDLLLLDVIQNQSECIIPVFEALFANNPPERIFSFLDENQSFIENLKVMASVPWSPFLNAIFRNLDHLSKI